MHFIFPHVASLIAGKFCSIARMDRMWRECAKGIGSLHSNRWI